MGRGENLQIRKKILRAGFFLEGFFFLGAARFPMARRLGLQNTDSTTPALTPNHPRSKEFQLTHPVELVFWHTRKLNTT